VRFDAGTDYVLAQVPETVTNVLRVKANPKATGFCHPDSGKETNMTVITTDPGRRCGRFLFLPDPLPGGTGDFEPHGRPRSTWPTT